jgi:hypothetical protein
MPLHEQNSAAGGAFPEPDAHGQAALLLAESMLHMLVERSIISVADAVAVVQTAAEVKVQVAAELGESKERMQASIDLLFRISDSFATDLPED